MASSAFRSMTKRTPVGKSSTSGEDDSCSSNRSSGHRRYRSLSRFSHRMPNLDAELPERTGRFVNAGRGSEFPEISLDDLAVEFFDSFSNGEGEDRGRSGSRKSDVSPGGGGETTVSQRRGRSVSRGSAGNYGSAGRVFSETESSRRRRSVSRGGVGNGGGAVRVDAESSRRRRSVSRQPVRGSVGAGRVDSEIGNPRRRRSVSVVRCRISDSESDQDHLQSSSNRGNSKSAVNGNIQITGSQKPASLYYRAELKSCSQTELKYNDGYFSQSSAATDDEGRDKRSSKQGIEKIIRAVHSQKGEHPTGEDVNSGLYEAMRKELRHAVEDIRTELEQATTKTRNSEGDSDYGSHLTDSDALHAVSTKLHQSEKRKKDLLAEILLEEQHGREFSKIVKELLTDPNNSARSKDRNRLSKCLTDEAEKYIEEFISSIEDTDISSLDDERSETSSNFGMMKMETFHTPPIPKSVPVEMGGIVLPWLQWETSNDASPLPNKNMLQHTPTSKSNIWEFDSTRDASIGYDASIGSISSSRGSWNPSDSATKSAKPRICQSLILSREQRKFKIDADDYLSRKSDKDFLYESWKQRHRIRSGGLLLCNHMII